MIIRNARIEDATETISLRRSIVDEGEAVLQYPGDQLPTQEEERDRIARFLKNFHWLYLVAEYEGAIVGMLTFVNGQYSAIQHNGEFSVYVAKANRGQGVGKKLISELLTWATKHPIIERVTLHVFSKNHAARKLYEQLGFKEEGYFRNEIKMADGSYTDTVVMVNFVKSLHQEGSESHVPI